MKFLWYKKFLNNLIIPPPCSFKVNYDVTFYALKIASIDFKEVCFKAYLIDFFLVKSRKIRFTLVFF